MLNENSGPNGGLGWDDARLADETAAAMRDLAGTVTDAPPLRLTAAGARDVAGAGGPPGARLAPLVLGRAGPRRGRGRGGRRRAGDRQE